MKQEQVVNEIVKSLNSQLGEAQHFLDNKINTEYWQGRKDTSQHILNQLKALGISAKEEQMK